MINSNKGDKIEKKDKIFFISMMVVILSAYPLMEDDQTLLYIFLIIFLIYSFISLYVSHRYGAQIKGWSSVVEEKDYTSILLTIPQAGIIGSLVITLYNGVYMQTPLLTGFLLMLGGMVFNLVVRKELGKNWVPLSKTTPHQELVTHGLYSRVRHPFYLSILILFTGVAVSSWNYYGLMFLLALLFGLIIRIKKEENNLIIKFGDEYIDYMKKTGMLIPKII
jgi:protein-S-isoprenylcysteine O-methyltransferase Ste14